MSDERPIKRSAKKVVKKKDNKKSVSSITTRLNILFAVIFVLFLVLLGRLYYMQIISKGFYAAKLRTAGAQATIKERMPRGQIFDAKGKLVASTTEIPSITFTRSQTTTSDEMRKNALQLYPILRGLIDPRDLTRRDLKDYYLSDTEHFKKISEKIPAKDQVDSYGRPLSESKIYAMMVEKVTNKEINYHGDDLLVAELYKLMNATKLFTTSNIVSGNITPEEQAEVAAIQSKLTGISFGENWQHQVDSNNLLASVIGTVSSEKAGLPSGKEDEYLAKGYSLNDRVGTSYLELAYENKLQGQHKVERLDVNSNGVVKETTTVKAGSQGDNLKLTVDNNFENGVQKILQDNYNDMLSQGFGQYSNGAYAVVMNPSTGAILSMNGINRDVATGQMRNDALGTITDAFTPGSVVKPGTLTAGWQSGAISGNQVLTSQPIQLAGSNTIYDWLQSGFGPIPADQALEYSSNTYMLQVALRMLGQNYSPNMTVDTSNRVKAYDEFRKAYGQYGLGVNTGIDIPGESTGLIPATSSSNASIANLLYESFGQFDNYTPMQLAQYAATLANNGTRVAPHLVAAVYSSDNSSLGKESSTIPTKVMNKVDISSDNMSIIHQGMYEVVHGDFNRATGAYVNQDASVSISAKTGTSQQVVASPNGTLVETTVNNIIAFAPSDNPQIAIGIMIPNTTGTVQSETHINQTITTQIVNLYKSMYGFK